MIKKLFEAALRGGSSITINGQSFSGRSIQIINDRVIVDGVEQGGGLAGPVSVIVHGDVDRLETASGDVEVAATCGSVKTVSGDVRCGNVAGDVGTVSGDVTCGSIGGSVKSVSGDVRMRGAP